MKTITICSLLSLFVSAPAFSQSDSFLTLRDKFSPYRDVYSFSTNAFFGGALFWLAGEHEFYDAVKRIKRISVITVPKAAFDAEHVTVSGFKKVVQHDSFETLAEMKDHGDELTFYMRPTQEKNNRYMILVEESSDVVVIELLGYIDPAFLLKCESHSSKQKL